ncbi:FeoA family protein [Cellulosilyticum sp. I15G10I2]|uniref:FeoA family protein n=1 Tax=Cellulosilyticum sp. I15G10I2 TaxID=1892843 RepID=UPI00085C366F|nr:FeoA family protein [Cellulosilyticum sp. I15G10I2]
MNPNLIPLHDLPIGCRAKVKKLTCSGVSRRRILDLGLIFDTTIESLSKSPFGDPIAYAIRGTVIALRLEETYKIFVESIE